MHQNNQLNYGAIPVFRKDSVDPSFITSRPFSATKEPSVSYASWPRTIEGIFLSARLCRGVVLHPSERFVCVKALHFT